MSHRIYELRPAGLFTLLLLVAAACKLSHEQGTYFPNRVVSPLEKPRDESRSHLQQGVFAGQRWFSPAWKLTEGDGLVLLFTRCEDQLGVFDAGYRETLVIELPMPESLPAEYEVTSETSVFYDVFALGGQSLEHCEGRVRLERADRSLLAVTLDLSMNLWPFEETRRWKTTAGFWRSNGLELRQ